MQARDVGIDAVDQLLVGRPVLRAVGVGGVIPIACS